MLNLYFFFYKPRIQNLIFINLINVDDNVQNEHDEDIFPHILIERGKEKILISLQVSYWDLLEMCQVSSTDGDCYDAHEYFTIRLTYDIYSLTKILPHPIKISPTSVVIFLIAQFASELWIKTKHYPFLIINVFM